MPENPSKKDLCMYTFWVWITVNTIYMLTFHGISFSGIFHRIYPDPFTYIRFMGGSSTTDNNCSNLLYLNETECAQKPTAVNHPFYYLITPEIDDNTSIVILLFSEARSGNNRKAIRKTWGSVATNTKAWSNNFVINYNISIIFVSLVSEYIEDDRKLHQEAKEYGDILLVEPEKNATGHEKLTLKYLFVFDYIYKEWKYVQYIVFSFDDSFIHIPGLVKTLLIKNRLPEKRIMGLCNSQVKNVTRKGEWKVSFSQYPYQHYPPWISGNFYALSFSTLTDLYEASQNMPVVFVENIYITGIIAQVAGVGHECLTPKTITSLHGGSLRKCDLFRGNKIAITQVYAHEQQFLWNKLKTNAHICGVNKH